MQIAIVGLAGRFPGARGLDDFWRNIRDGVESLEIALVGGGRKGRALDVKAQT